MRAHRPAATLATAAIIATSFAACDDTIAYAASLAPVGSVGGDQSVREGERILDLP